MVNGSSQSVGDSFENSGFIASIDKLADQLLPRATAAAKAEAYFPAGTLPSTPLT